MTAVRFPAETDKTEAEHRVDVLAGRVFCSCLGFVNHGHCKHADKVRKNMEQTGLIVQDHPPGSDLPDVWRSPTDLARRLEDLKQERTLVQDFFKTIMVKDEDYGTIPGTDKPTLYKAGAEKLCELYGYAPIVSDVQETTDYETGHYRVVVRMALVHKGTGVKIAEGIGECNTRESRYAYRWVYRNEIPSGIDILRFKSKEFTGRNGSKYIKFRLENDDLFSLWNTILKMGKKRALVDATLASTRSSGLFTQDAAKLDEWIEGEFEDVTDNVQAPPKPAPPAPPTPEGPLRRGSANGDVSARTRGEPLQRTEDRVAPVAQNVPAAAPPNEDTQEAGATVRGATSTAMGTSTVDGATPPASSPTVWARVRTELENAYGTWDKPSWDALYKKLCADYPYALKGRHFAASALSEPDAEAVLARFQPSCEHVWQFNETGTQMACELCGVVQEEETSGEQASLLKTN